METPKASHQAVELTEPIRGLTLTRKLHYGLKLTLDGKECLITVTQIKGKQVRLTILGPEFQIDRTYCQGYPPG